MANRDGYMVDLPANGSNVPPCPILAMSLLLFRFLPFGFPVFPSLCAASFSCSTNKEEVLIKFFKSLIIAIDVGPEGFATAKRPESGNGGRVSLGIRVLDGGWKGAVWMERRRAEDQEGRASLA